jgi:hypothetical protein
MSEAGSTKRSPPVSSPRTSASNTSTAALPAPDLAVGTVDLDYFDASGPQVAGQAGPIRAGAFDPHSYYFTETRQPAQQFVVPIGGGGELGHA